MPTPYDPDNRQHCRHCKTGREAYERFSLGITAGRWCGPCWEKSGYRKEGPEGFDPMDAGEHYSEEDY